MRETDGTGVVARMVGRELAVAEHKSFAGDEIMLEVDNISRGNAVHDASLRLHKGEVIGISGLVGAGRTELLRLIAGVDKPDGGEVRIEGKALQPGNARAAIAAGLGLLPEERKRDGIVARRSIRSNIGLSSMRRFSRFGFVRQRALARESQKLMEELNLRPLDINRPIGRFSGGNQQKAIIGRWIAAGARILLFDEPTRGIDVGAKAEIYTLIEKLAAEGRSVIVVSSELPEILRVSDRVLVMREGQIAGVLERHQLSEEAIVALAVPQSQRVFVPREVDHVDHDGSLLPPGKGCLGFAVRDAGTLFGLMAIVVVFSVLTPTFLTEQNILNILQQSSINACVALGMTLVIIAGGIDLSVGPTAAISAIAAASLMAAAPLSSSPFPQRSCLARQQAQ